jgi:hypothetical protein
MVKGTSQNILLAPTFLVLVSKYTAIVLVSL